MIAGTTSAAACHHLGVLGKPVFADKIIPGNLGSAFGFSLLGTSITDSLFSSCNKDAGCSNPAPANVGMTVGGAAHYGDAVAAAAIVDSAAAYAYYLGLPATGTVTADYAGKTFTPGVYYSIAFMVNSAVMTCDGTGYPDDALFVFQVNAALAPAAGSSIHLVNCKANQIVFVCVGAPSIGAGAAMTGTVLSVAAITIGAGATLNGRALSHFAALTTSNNVITTT